MNSYGYLMLGIPQGKPHLQSIGQPLRFDRQTSTYNKIGSPTSSISGTTHSTHSQIRLSWTYGTDFQVKCLCEDDLKDLHDVDGMRSGAEYLKS
jgi:hypothetical protein